MTICKGIAGLAVIAGFQSLNATTLSAAEAKNHIGENATVCGRVASERTATSSRGEPTFINLDAAYPNQIFTILIWGEDKPKLGTLPYEGSRVVRRDLFRTIEEYGRLLFGTAVNSASDHFELVSSTRQGVS